jgi:hypothetical protein
LVLPSVLTLCTILPSKLNSPPSLQTLANRGGKLIDTASSYGSAETVLGGLTRAGEGERGAAPHLFHSYGRATPLSLFMAALPGLWS